MITRQTIHRDSETGLVVTAWPAPGGGWHVRFLRRSSGARLHDKTGHWLASGRWDQHRWYPEAGRLNPRTRMALVVVEAWLKAQPVITPTPSDSHA
jgi:hypothetical protein